jgi:hypothetical protein
MAILSSRAQTCMNPAVKALPSQGINQACRALTSKRACKWCASAAPAWGCSAPVCTSRRRLGCCCLGGRSLLAGCPPNLWRSSSGTPAQPTLCLDCTRPGRCLGFDDPAAWPARTAPCRQNGVERYVRSNPSAGEEPMDIEDLATLGSQHTLCPYYLSRQGRKRGAGGGGGADGHSGPGHAGVAGHAAPQLARLHGRGRNGRGGSVVGRHSRAVVPVCGSPWRLLQGPGAPSRRASPCLLPLLLSAGNWLRPLSWFRALQLPTWWTHTPPSPSHPHVLQGAGLIC